MTRYIPRPVPDDVIAALEELPDGPWKVWTSCSFRRISAKADGDVLCGINQISDGHPDLSMSERQLTALCRIVNGLREASQPSPSDIEGAA